MVRFRIISNAGREAIVNHLILINIQTRRIHCSFFKHLFKFNYSFAMSISHDSHFAHVTMLITSWSLTIE